MKSATHSLVTWLIVLGIVVGILPFSPVAPINRPVQTDGIQRLIHDETYRTIHATAPSTTGNAPYSARRLADTGNVITITQSGFQPSVLTVTLGMTVTWFNATAITQTLVTGEPYRVYLPLIMRGGGAAQAAARAYDSARSYQPVPLMSNETFSATLAPGATFTYTFANESMTKFYLSTAPQFTGQVIAQMAVPPDPADIAPPIDPTVPTDFSVATSFLYSGTNPIQTGVVSGTIEERRVGVIRGRVLKRDGTPLRAVQIAVLNHPEYGQTLSRDDGMFDIAVNGGGVLTLDYARQGYLPAQRQANVPWLDSIWLPDVVLIQADPNVTTIDLNSPVPMQVARGSVISDSSGLRQATLLFPVGTRAFMTLTNGLTQTLTTLHVRLTEYTVGPNGPQAMPGDLPPTSGYTYSPEFNVDEAAVAGATSVGFSQPVISYNENFLNFPVGIIVPLGYYDRSSGLWIPAPNGRVIKIVSITNGLAELDTDGDGVVDNGVALGITDAERQALAMLYMANQSLWRVPITHFTPWDQNFPYGPPPDATAPNMPDPQNGDFPQPDPNTRCGSIVECQNQTLGESVGIVGTPFSLNYRSDLVPGRSAANRLYNQLSGTPIPDSLVRIDLEIVVAGRKFFQQFPAAPNQSYTFVWDGKDAYGRALQGQQPINVRIGYVYPAVYQTPAEFAESFAVISGLPLTGNSARREITWWQIWQGEISSWTNPSELGGWSLNVHHTNDPVGKILYLGDGTRRNIQDTGNIINTVAGNGVLGYSGDGGFAAQARLYQPRGVAVAADGSLYIADTANYRIRRVSPDGIITTTAGNGVLGYSGDGGPATQARLNAPSSVAVAADGSLYIADEVNHRVRRVSPDGIITTVAGIGAFGYDGDGGPATQARLNLPRGVAVAADGSVYIADFGNHRIRRVGTAGMITTVAGNGTQGSGGDGGPATQASLSATGVAVAADGSVYIADYGNHRIRRVGTDGIITTVAGNGLTGYGGDGGTATQARLDNPWGVAVGADGSLYIADQRNHRVRHVGPDGIITTVAGNGLTGYGGDGGPATQARMTEPLGVATGANGNVYIAVFSYHRIRAVKPVISRNIGETGITSEDGREIYVFTRSGRHLRTFDALTGALRYEFAYDSTGRLLSVIDGDGNLTTIERDTNGNPTAVVAPFGQRTTLTLNANGYLQTLTNPANEKVQFGYTAGGLMTSMVDARNFTHTFQYDSLGRLTRDADPAAGFMTLARVEVTDTYTVALSTALALTTTYRVEHFSNDAIRRVNTYPNGLQDELVKNPDGTRFSRSPDGTTQRVTLGPDPRWGMLAPVSTQVTATLPSGLTWNTQVTRTAALTQPGNVHSLATLTETVAINGRPYTSTYTAATRTWVERSPEGRVVTTTTDMQGRVVFEQVASLSPASYNYDGHGRLITATLGAGTQARVASFSYNSDGYLDSVTDPLNRTVRFDYDLAGRVVSQTLPDGRVINYGYDTNSNLTSLTPPGRPAHTFDYTPIDLTSRYTPPDVNPGIDYTQYTYNADRQLTQIARPDGQTIGVGYDTAGRLNALTIVRGIFNYAYHPTTGNLSSISAPGNVNLVYAYDGVLPKSQTWSGVIAGTTVYTYDNNLRRTAIDLNGASPIALQYDKDSLLTQAGALTLTRNPLNGLLTGSTMGAIADSWSYNNFGEPSSYTARSLFNVQYEHDQLGRIVTKTETISGVTDVYVYGYDLAGRLSDVSKNGVQTSAYTYDSNGNRLSYTGSSLITGTYDAQDRLLTYGSTIYGYTANGELLTKTANSQVTRYAYDEVGNLTQVILPDGTQIDYLIDGQNRRVGKKVNGVLTQALLYESQLQPIAELDGAGNVVSRFVYATRINAPDYMIKAGTTYRFILDHLGSPRFVVNATTGQIAQRMDYDEFGRVLNDTNPGFQPFGFAGGLYDPDTGLVRFGARDYDVTIGRWTAKDYLGFAAADTSLYVYAGNDPVNQADYFGFEADLIIIPAGDKIARYAKKISPPPDELIVVVHGYPGGPVDENKNAIEASDLARRIRESPRFGTAKSVRLVSCNLGKESRFSQTLADYLGKPVWAGTNFVEVRSDGSYGVQQPGKWRDYKPTGDIPLGPKDYPDPVLP
jgi:RHS repeat-associated protein